MTSPESHSSVPDSHFGRAYVTVTLSYWAFMLTDGALRMLVLLHFHTLGFSAIHLAYLFLVYELMGVVTNIIAGWIGSRYGLNALIYSGLGLQIVALLALTQLQDDWSILVSVLFAMAVQGLSGIAKDLIKTGAKSSVKLLSDASDNGRLFFWVARLTGSKNAIKGIGFFVGATLLSVGSFSTALFTLAALLVLVLLPVATWGRIAQGKLDTKARIRDVFSTTQSVNILSVARFFLFGARDTWFVVAVPVFLLSSLTSGASVEPGKAFLLVGSFLALWVIAYGFIQAKTPDWLRGAKDSLADSQAAAKRWSFWLFVIMLGLSAMAALPGHDTQPIMLLIVAGLFVFGAVFAVNSSLHSYLILALTNRDRTTMDVGFYYMANAAGRLIGVLLSGLCYQLGGLFLSLAIASLMAALSHMCIRKLH